jgi:hypothetical protein
MGKRSSDSRELTTKEEVMTALGGIAGISALTGSEYGAVENWKRLRTFPSRCFLVMTFALHKKRLSAPPELWGQVTPAERKQALASLIAAQRRRVAA